MPLGTACNRRETTEHNFSQHNERRHLRTGSDECGARDRRTLISVRRPKMKRRGGDFEGEANKGHDDANEKQRRDWLRGEFLRDRGETSRASHSVNEAESEKRERARRAAEEEIFQARFGRMHIVLVERGHDVKR